MTSRFSLPARAAASVLTLLLLAGGWTGFAQTSPSPEPSATPKPKRAYLRFWNLLPKTSTDTFDLVPAADPKGKAFRTAPPFNVGATYEEVVPGRYVLNLYRGSDHDKPPLKTFDTTLADKDYVSIIVHPGADPAAPPEAELTVDSLPPDQPADNRLTVRQCLPGASVTVAVARAPATGPMGFGAVQTFKDLPKGLVPVAMSIATGSGRPTRLTTEADFSYGHRVTILVMQDFYGRLRPRAIPDGPSNLPEETPAPSVAATPKPATSPSPTPAASPARPTR